MKDENRWARCDRFSEPYCFLPSSFRLHPFSLWQSVRHLRNVPIYSIPSIIPPITFLQAFPVGPAWVAGGFGLTGSAAAPTNRTYEGGELS